MTSLEVEKHPKPCFPHFSGFRDVEKDMPTGCPSNGFLDEYGRDLHDYRKLPSYGYQPGFTASRYLTATCARVGVTCKSSYLVFRDSDSATGRLVLDAVVLRRAGSIFAKAATQYINKTALKSVCSDTAIRHASQASIDLKAEASVVALRNPHTCDRRAHFFFLSTHYLLRCLTADT